MSYPVLYPPNATSFENNGLGILSSCKSCEVVEDVNGLFEAKIKCPADGIHVDEITSRSILKIKFDRNRNPQLFRVYNIQKTISGLIEISAAHISYDLSGIPVQRFFAINAKEALETLKSDAIIPCPFNFSTDIEKDAYFQVSVPSSIRSKLGGSEESIQEFFGGEYEFDNFDVILHQQRGKDTGVSIRYGKNMTNFSQDQNCADVVTAIYPFWAAEVDGERVVIELPEKTVSVPGQYDFNRIVTVDLTSEIEQRPTEGQLREAAEKYIEENEIGVPKFSIDVSFVNLSQTEEYSHLAHVEKIGLFDFAHVYFDQIGVSTTAKVVRIVHDALGERATNISMGTMKKNIADTLAELTFAQLSN